MKDIIIIQGELMKCDSCGADDLEETEERVYQCQTCGYIKDYNEIEDDEFL